MKLTKKHDMLDKINNVYCFFYRLFSKYLDSRKFRFFLQRKTRGWDDSETWSLDFKFAQWIYPRIKRFKELNIGHPSGLTEEEWDCIIQQMIDGFEIMSDEQRYFWYSDEDGKKIKKAMKLWYKHHEQLWF